MQWVLYKTMKGKYDEIQTFKINPFIKQNSDLVAWDKGHFEDRD
jgi:hypothetical protein